MPNFNFDIDIVSNKNYVDTLNLETSDTGSFDGILIAKKYFLSGKYEFIKYIAKTKKST